MTNCKTCSHPVAQPWRTLNEDGTVRFGCVATDHDSHADAWHVAQAHQISTRF